MAMNQVRERTTRKPPTLIDASQRYMLWRTLRRYALPIER